MQKLTFLKNYLLELSFLALLIRVLYCGAGIGEALVFVSLVVSMAYSKWLVKEKDDRYEVVVKKLEDFMAESDRKFDNIAAKFSSQNIEKSLKKQVDNNEQESPFKRRNF